MHRLWRCVDGQFALKIASKPFHLEPIRWVLFLDGKNGYQAAA